MNFPKKNQYYTYKILLGCDNDIERRSICNLVNNFLYLNVFSSKSISNGYLFVIYRLIKKEMKSKLSESLHEIFENNSIFVYLCQDLINNYFIQQS